ncbi:MAG: YraN family protein, partial [Chloroflexota bacterium]
MSRPQQRVGRWGEQAAAEYLEKRGYLILARNFRTKHGEIDLIARQDNILVFVEVKARSSNR